MAVRVHLTIECPSMDDALSIVESAHQQLDSDDSRSLVHVTMSDTNEPPF